MAEPDFSGWATKNGLKCSDGRTIMDGAFKHQDKMKVPLVWQHRHDDPTLILGHAILSHREEGVYAHAYFNNSAKALEAKEAVRHGDVESLSIYANKLQETNKMVRHGDIKEVSLVLAGANPGALIENVYIRHGDNVEAIEGEAIMYFDQGISIVHSDESGDDDEISHEEVQDFLEELEEDQKEVVHSLLHSALTGTESDLDPERVQEIFHSFDRDQEEIFQSLIGDALEHASLNHTEGGNMPDLAHANGKTVKEVLDSFSEEQENVLYFLIGKAVEDAKADGGSAKHAEIDPDVLAHAIQEGLATMPRIFETTDKSEGKTLSHDQLSEIFAAAQKGNGAESFKEVFLEHAGTFGIDDIEFLFPDAKAISNTPEFISRRMEWVSEVLTGTKHSPISRIKTIHADITADEARARGYVKGNLKKEEVFKLLKRKTEPTTIYKKQKLDRDDILDITDLDVVAFLKAEMRLMLDEEVARCVLVGDGREVESEDKVDEERLRPIATDDDMYAHKVTLVTNSSVQQKMDLIVRSMDAYKGSGAPVMFTTRAFVSDMLLERDRQGRKLYNTRAEVAATLQVSKIIDVEVLEQHPEIVAIIVNLADYTIGADKGAALGMFEDFDIDYNQYKYLMETRISGALTKAKSAIVVKREVGIVVTPLSPSFNSETNTVTYPNTAGVVYRVDGVPVSGDDVITTTTEIDATPATGYSFPSNVNKSWTFVPSAE
ncbi:major capsid and protease fusion protein [Arthrobacter phage Darby]|uniref:Major capsid and protease fusion protein n=2 Tax=Gordonvirus TaxID=1982152 RepID=A0A9E7SYM7_9CAUD|nr:major capsid and capsid maturation protease [Arthrobacter phage Trustiboi]YP_010750464.1 major capsid and protease fusion protein [Arthrobacter phage Darby]UTN91577.1 major capsid and capsid maturation protease [Arthrobacter phage Trustiboi]UTN92018.1 major capsid and protease fusion protein [Arthrobacter phage Darby]